METGPAAMGFARHWNRFRSFPTWKIREIPAAARTLIAAVELGCLVAFALAVHALHSRPEYLVRWAVLAVLSVVYAEIASRMDRMRRYLSAGAHISMTSVWAFAAVLTLPAAYAGSLVALLFGYSNWRRRRQRSIFAHRAIYTAATGILAALAASAAGSALLDQLPVLPAGLSRALATLCALIVYFAINGSLILATIYLAIGPVSVRQLLPEREELSLEFGTLVLGIFTAETLLVQPWLTPLVMVLMALLQRSSLVTQLELAAATDAKTGLLNASAWQELALRELLRCQNDVLPCAVLLLDLDHFKNVNDTLGHLAGDSALRAIGDALKRELRGYDAVARFGGEEFVVFLNDLDLGAAQQVAERTLTRIRGLRIQSTDGTGNPVALTASIGLAAYPEHGQDLTDLLEAADVALYGAKRAGRNQVGLPPSASAAVPRRA